MIPEIELTLPRPIVSIHQIETSSRCSLSCAYCVWPKLGRTKQDMTRETFERALVHVDYCVNQLLEQTELNLAGIGESTLHPEFPDFVRMAREVVGKDCFLTFASNGTHFTEEIAKAIAPYMSVHHGFKPGVFISLHRPEKAKFAVDIARKYGLLAGVSQDPAMATINWAGQVPYEVTAPPNRPCMWLRDGKAIVLSDGSVSTCCMDSAHLGVIGHVNDPVGSLKSQPYSLCANCDQIIAIKGHQQGRKLPTL